MTRNGQEKRQFGRRRTLIHAVIVLAKGRQMSCIVRNVSQGGALLEVDEPKHVPLHFRLYVAADQFLADCEVRHRSEHGVGVLFKAIRIGRGGRDTREAAPNLSQVQSASPTEPGRPAPQARGREAPSVAR